MIIKRLVIASLPAFMLVSGQAMSMNASDEAAGSTVPMNETGHAGDMFDVWMPNLRGRSFDVIDGSFRTSFNLGCDGIAETDIVANISQQVERMVEYVQRNAAGLAINYAAYSTPVLYNVMETLNQEMNWFKDMSMFTCSSIRDMASDQRIARESVDRCMQDEKDPYVCNTEEGLAEAREEVLNETQATRDALTGKHNATTVDIFQYYIPPSIKDDDSSSPDEFSELLEDLVPARKIDPSTDSVELVDRPMVISKYLQTRATHYFNLYESLTNSGSSANARSVAYNKLAKDAAVKRVSINWIDKMRSIHEVSPAQHAALIEVVSTRAALDNTKYNIARIKSALQNGELMAKEGLFTDEDKIFYAKAIKALDDEFALVALRLEAGMAQADIQNQIMKEY